MIDYAYVSPSLEGVLTHDSLLYEGVRRPLEILRAFDGAKDGDPAHRKPDRDKLLERYFYDLYGVFMKKLSAFVLEDRVDPSDTVKLQAMLQEMIKIKKLIAA